MRARLKPVLEKLAGLLWYLGRPPLFCLWLLREHWPKRMDGLWTMVHRPEWQKSSGFSAGLLLITVSSLHFATKRYGSGLEVVAIQTVASDAVTFGFNKKMAFTDRRTTTGTSGTRSTVIFVVCFVYHKALAFILLSTVGWSPVETRMMLAGVGVVENPVLFRVRDVWAFTPDGRRDRAEASQKQESARAESAGHWFWSRIRA